MLSVIICEDDNKQLQRMIEVVKNYILIEELDMKLVLATDNPDEVLEHVHANPKESRLYFFDVDLNHELSGLTLASEIRKLDDIGKIVFVTTHGELSYLTFTYKVEAMDYIIKDNKEEVERRIRECMDLSVERYLMDKNTKAKRFKVKVGDTIRSIPYDEIMFFESSTSSHRVVLHMKNRQLEFYGSIRELEEKDECLYRCHKSFVVNKNNIQSVNQTERIAEMTNGEEVLISVRGLRKLKNLDD